MTVIYEPPVAVETGLSIRLDETAEPWHALLSHEFGVIKELMELKVHPAEVQMFVFGARTGGNLRHVGSLSDGASGSGASLDRQSAMRAAVGETIERYCPLFVQATESIQEGSFNEIVGEAVRPGSFSLFAESQYAQLSFPYARFDDETRAAWVAMTRLHDGVSVSVPVQFVYLRHQHKSDVAVVSPYVSTGLACAPTREQAILKGIYEAVERDAFNIAWLSRLALRTVDVSGTNDARLGQALDAVARAHLTPHFVWLTLDIDIPIVFCALVDDSGTRGACAVGASANLDPVVAAAKAVEEAAHTRHWLSSLRRTPKTFTRTFSDVRDFDDHVLLYGTPDMVARASFFWSNRSSISLNLLPSLASGSPRQDVETCVQRLRRAHLDVLAKDLTTPDIAECGLFVARTVVPGLQNINGPHRYRLLGGRRLYDTPHALGLVPRKLDEDQLNPDPHPFP